MHSQQSWNAPWEQISWFYHPNWETLPFTVLASVRPMMWWAPQESTNIFSLSVLNQHIELKIGSVKWYGLHAVWGTDETKTASFKNYMPADTEGSTQEPLGYTWRQLSSHSDTSSLLAKFCCVTLPARKVGLSNRSMSLEADQIAKHYVCIRDRLIGKYTHLSTLVLYLSVTSYFTDSDYFVLIDHYLWYVKIVLRVKYWLRPQMGDCRQRKDATSELK